MTPRRSDDVFPIVRSAGLSPHDSTAACDATGRVIDPFVAFDELMELVEALVPDEPRPPRPIIRGLFRL